MSQIALKWLLVTTVLGSSFRNCSLCAQDLSPQDLRISQLEAELAQLRNDVTGAWISSSQQSTENVGPSGAYAGAGAYYLRPIWEGNPAYNVQNISTSEFRTVDFDYNMQFAPVVWFGYRGASGLGARARYWTLSDGAKHSVTNDGSLRVGSASPLGLFTISENEDPDAPFRDVLTFQSELNLSVIDLEATQMFQRGAWTFEFSGGARYSRLEQAYRHSALNRFGDFPELGGIVVSRHDFEGVGPTASCDVRRVIADSNLIWYGTTRASALFGEFEQTATVVRQFGASTHSEDHLDVLPIAELETGFEVSIDVGTTRLSLLAGFVRASCKTRFLVDEFLARKLRAM